MIASRAPEVDSSYELMHRNMATLLRRHPRGIGILLLVMHSEKPPEDFVPRALNILRTYRAQILGAGGIIEHSGFVGAAHRAVGQSLITLSGMRGVIHVFGDIPSASQFMAERLLPTEQRAFGAPAMRTAITGFRARVAAQISDQAAAVVG